MNRPGSIALTVGAAASSCDYPDRVLQGATPAGRGGRDNRGDLVTAPALRRVTASIS